MTDPTENRYPLLAGIERPADLRGLEEAELVQLAQEIRDFLIESVSKTGGHLSPNLGVVELTIARVRVELECGRDQILLVDSLTRLGRAFNVRSGSGKRAGEFVL